MRAWRAVLLLNLALVVGAGWGYAWWGRRIDRLDAELAGMRTRADRLARELAAARPPGTAAAATETSPPGTVASVQQWEVRGVIRAVVPEMNLVVITHEEIPDYMPSMTMGFRAAAPAILESARVGDRVRFTLRGTPPDVVVTAVRRTQ